MIDYSEYGDSDGELVIYFHGSPGTVNELDWFKDRVSSYNVRIVCFERYTVALDSSAKEYYQTLATEIDRVAQGKCIHLIGFSIGAFIATKVVPFVTAPIQNVHLVSPAVPLSLGDFLPQMAGQQVFAMARDKPKLFSLLSYVQSFIVRLSPKLMFKMVFADVKGKDKLLVEDRLFKKVILNAFKGTFIDQLEGYMRDISEYVNTEHFFLLQIGIDVHLWHGGKDNWSPVEMSQSLAKLLNQEKRLTVLPDCSHYSCLLESLPNIFEQLTNSSELN